MNRPDWSFMLDEQACDDHITARFPRTSREAFGHYSQPQLEHHITFLPRQRGGWIALAVVVALIVFSAGVMA